jgi:hypothetical protein
LTHPLKKFPAFPEVFKIFSQLEKRRASRTRKAAQPPKEPIARAS